MALDDGHKTFEGDAATAADIVRDRRVTGRGDPVSDLYEREANALRQFLRRKLANPSDVEEVMQEAYLRLHNARGRGNIANLRGFLFRIATNLAIDHYRAIGHSVSTVGIDEESRGARELVAEIRTPEEHAIINEQLRTLMNVIEHLPPRCRQVFVLHRIKQMTHSEIAQELKISTQMVEKHIARAIRVCTEKMVKFRDPPPVSG